MDESTVLLQIQAALKSFVLKKGLNSIWEYLFKKDTFDKALESTLKNLDQHYKSKVLGGHSQIHFNKNPELITKLKEFLVGYGNPGFSDVEGLDLKSLPPDFKEVLQDFLVKELVEFPDLRQGLVEWLKTDQISRTLDNTEFLRDDISKLIDLLTKNGTNSSIQRDISKINYHAEKEYIPRTVIPIDQVQHNKLERRFLWKDSSEQGISLVDLVKQKKHIALLGVAGCGKSIELKNLAHHLSIPEEQLFPIFIQFNDVTSRTLEEVLDATLGDWRHVNQNELILVLDALDEVHSSDLDYMGRSIMRFCIDHPQIRIVLSCRNNLYQLGRGTDNSSFNGFDEYVIDELSDFQIRAYLSKHLDVEVQPFIDESNELNIVDLLVSPFYLIRLCEIHNEKGKLPERKATLFKWLIDKRIDKDFEKFKSVGLDLDAYRRKIRKTIMNLAFASQCLGRNYIDEETELLSIIEDDSELFVRIKRTFSLNKGKEGRWRFEHNNFQEYLAALLLSEKSLEVIKSCVSYTPNHSKIKPFWVNTLSLLVSILEHDDSKTKALLSWVIKTEPDLLFRMERDKLDIKVREKIALQVIDYYESKNLWLRSEKFDLSDVSKFVSDSQELRPWCINRLRMAKNDLVFVNSIELLRAVDGLELFKKEVAEILINSIEKEQLSDFCIQYIVDFLIQMDIKDDIVISILQSHPEHDESQYVRAYLYKYITFMDYADDKIDILIGGLSLIKELEVVWNRESYAKSSSHIFTEKENLISAFKTIKQKKSVLEVLKYGTHKDKIDQYDHDEELFETIVKCINKYPEWVDQEVLKVLADFLATLNRWSDNSLYKLIISSLDDLGIRLEVFKIMYYRSIKDKQKPQFWDLAEVANQKAIEFLFDAYKEGSVDDEFVRVFRNFLPLGDNDLRNWFHDNINEYSSNKFPYDSPEPNWEEQRKSRNKRDLELLFDKAQFLNASGEIFKKLEKEDISKKDISRTVVNREFYLDNDIVPYTLRELAKEKPVLSIRDVQEFVRDQERWEWLVLFSVLQKDQGKYVNISDRELSFIESWYTRKIAKADFKDGMTISESKIHWKPTERKLIYLYQSYRFLTKESQILNFIYMDDPSYLMSKYEADKDETIGERKNETLVDFVEKEVGFEKTRSKVFECLEHSNLSYRVKINLFAYCKRKAIYDALPFILEEVRKNQRKSYYMKILFESYFVLEGDPELVIDLLPFFEFETKIHFLKELGKNNISSFEDKCLRLLKKESDQKKQVELISLLIEFEFLSGFKELSEWINLNKRAVNIYFDIEPSESLLEGVIPYYISIYQDSVTNGFGSYRLRNSCDDFLEILIKAGSMSEEAYKTVSEKFTEWIEILPDHNFLHLRQKELDKNYYAKVTPIPSLDEIKRMLS